MPAATYMPLRRISAGPRFSVFRGRGPEGSAVIIKQAVPGGPELRTGERLAHEHEILRALDVPGIPRPLDFTTIDGQAALVLEDAGAHNLSEIAGGRPLAVGTFLDLATRMAEIVRGLHGRSVIHRDLCPDNFVLDEPLKKVSLVDFETATPVPAFAEAPGLPGALEGTLPYMAPEQTGRMKRLVDRRADLYALGATFYELLTGKPPFPSRDPLELVHAHAARAPHPPAIVNPAVPTTLSDLVLKLLAKMPEWRYQTAEALVADLEEAGRQWRDRGAIEPFELGRRDVPFGLFLEPDKLHGRDQESRRLADAFARAAAGPAEVVLVTGPVGIGKSALVNGLRELVLPRCRWISGKGDQLRGNIPHALLGEAFRELAQGLGREPEAHLAALRGRLQRAVAPNGRVLTDTFPDLRALLGDAAPVAKAGAVEEENRLQLAFVAFLRALAAEGPPLVLFLDDLQWADRACLKLLQALATDPEARSLLILGAWRSEGVGPDHPVTSMVEQIRSAGARVETVEPGPLDREAILALLCTALRAEPDRVAPLAEVVQRKTAGNPFFVRQLLGYLYRMRLLVFGEDARWTWDLAGIEAAEVTPNVVDLLSRVLETLPRRTQEALGAAACIGNRFELSLLAGVLGEPMAVARALWAPVQQGLLVPAPEGPRFGWDTARPVELGTEIAPAFRFVHDRVQQAAYELLPEGTRKDLHLRIGRWLEQHVPEEAFESAVGPIVDQLDRAADLLPPAERTQLAALNQLAGQQARATAAYASALGYFQSGLRLLPAGAWRGALHEIWFGLQRDAAECAGLTGDYELSERLVDEGLGRTGALLEKVALHAVSVQTNALGGAHDRAIQRGRRGLALLGIGLPEAPSPRAADGACACAAARLRGRSNRRLLEAGPMDDPLDRARLQLLVSVSSSSWFIGPELFRDVACRAVELTATRGLAPGSASACAFYAIALAMRGEYEEAQRFGELGARLARRLQSPVEESRTLLLLGGQIKPWRAPFAETLPILQRAYALGIESGDLEFAAYSLANILLTRLFAGAPLDQVLAEAESALAFYRRIRHLSGISYVLPFAQAVRCLKGLTRGPASFDDDRFEEARHLAGGAATGLGQATLHILRLQTCYLHGEPELAWEYARRSAPWLPYLRTLFWRVDFHFYASLTIARLVRGADPAEKEALLVRLREHLAPLEEWAGQAPANFRHKRDLVAAELARIEDRPAGALPLYHRAIEQAGRGGFVQDEALSHELCGRLHRALGAGRMADLHLQAALDGYARWGATTKAALLGRELPSLDVTLRSRYLATPSAPPPLDYYSLVKTSQTLTEELALEPLLVKLVRTCGEAAEAERTALVLEEDGVLATRATATAGGEAAVERTPLATARDVPVSVVEQVFRSGEVLVLGDAARARRHLKDPYLSARGVRSVMAVPIGRADRTLGVLYFENTLASDAFTPERAEMFKLLSAQLAIAIQNSRLFEERRRSEAMQRLLSEASAHLAETLDSQELLSKVTAATVPALADWCVVDVLEDGVLRPAAWAHVDPAGASLVEELHRRYPVDAGSPRPQGDVLRSQRPLLIREVTEEALRTSVRDERHLRLMRALGPRSVMIVPLVARGRSLGVVTLVCTHPTRRYGPADLAVAEELVRRIGLALSNARLHRDLQEALRQREDRDRHLRMIFRQLPGGVWAVDRDFRVTYATGRDEQGLDLDRLVGTSGYDFIGTRDPTDPIVARHRAALGGERQSFDYFFRGRWLAIQVDSLRDPDQRIVGCVGVAFDVTEKRELIRKLEDAVARWEATIDATAEGILVTDLEGNVSAINPRFLHLWGLPEEAAGPRPHLQLLSPALDQLEEPEAFQRRLREIYAHQGLESFDVLRFKDGRTFERRSIPQRIGQEITGRVWSVRDVTERERLLQRAVFLGDAARLLASLEVEQALEGVAQLAVPALGSSCAIDLFGDGTPRRLIAVSRDPGMPVSPEVHPAVLGGTPTLYQVGTTSRLGVPLLIKGGLVGAITLAAPPHHRYTRADLELTEELARRAALAIDNARLYRQAQEALRARDELLSIAAHEIRGPINSIHLAVQTIRQARAPPEALPRLFEIVERQDRRLSQFVSELLDLGRIRAGRFQLEYEDEVDLGEVVREVAARLGPELTGSGSSLTVTVQGRVVGQWDRSRLDQVASNLLSNAIKFGLGKPIEISAGVDGDRAILAVTDRGTGIEPEVQRRLFKPFERGVPIRHYGGLGLGLHIVKTIVDALGGSVHVESTPGVGSTFTVELPLARMEAVRDAHPHH